MNTNTNTMNTNKKIIRLTESELKNIIAESVKKALNEISYTTRVQKIPSWAICYLINGDRDNLDDEEIDMIDKWIDKSMICEVGVPDDEPYFSIYPVFGKPCDVYDCVCLYRK